MLHKEKLFFGEKVVNNELYFTLYGFISFLECISVTPIFDEEE